jgi:RNA polymerase sigma factor (sigma-70 family)
VKPSDAELVQRTRAGERAAFDVLVHRYQRDVIALAYSLLGDGAEAQDMAQETFVRAYQNLGLLADPERFGAWLRRVTFGTCIDWLRAFRPALFRADDDAVDVPSNAPSALDRIEQGELSQRVREAMARLPEHYRVPLAMYHLDGLSQDKVARALGVPASTVRSLITRARWKLAPLLESYAKEDVEMQARLDDVFENADEATPKLLHVLNGDCTADGLRQSDVPGMLAVWADVLHEGPVPPDDDLESWLEIRTRFHTSDVADEEANVIMRDWQAELEKFRDYDEVVLWFEHDLFDQLLLIRHLSWWARQDPGLTRLSLICIGEYPGFPNFHGLGELSPDQLASLLDTRQLVTQRQIELGRTAWSAFTADDPARLVQLLERDTSALQFLDGALLRMLEDYPAVSNGLPRTERQILEQLVAGPKTPDELFVGSAQREERVFMGDATFWDRLHYLAREPAPLIEWDMTTRPPRLPGGAIRITDAGRAVLEERADWLRISGIDRWIGGVHLTCPGPHWRWDAGRRVLIRA